MRSTRSGLKRTVDIITEAQQDVNHHDSISKTPPGKQSKQRAPDSQTKKANHGKKDTQAQVKAKKVPATARLAAVTKLAFNQD